MSYDNNLKRWQPRYYQTKHSVSSKLGNLSKEGNRTYPLLDDKT